MKICISILAENSRSALRQMKTAQALADMVELRIDRMDGSDLNRLLQIKSVPVIVTNRIRREGGFFTGTEAERLSALKQAVSLGADIIDLELQSGRKAISELASHIRETGGKTKLMLSFHDFNGTPSDRFLKSKMYACSRLGADIIKIVTFAKKIEDNLIPLKLISAAKGEGLELVSFCMGDLGRISRVAAPLFGAPFTFASLKQGAESAPGQIAADDFKKLFSVLAPNCVESRGQGK